jgi:hypothetical protein
LVRGEPFPSPDGDLDETNAMRASSRALQDTAETRKRPGEALYQPSGSSSPQIGMSFSSTANSSSKMTGVKPPRASGAGDAAGEAELDALELV